MGEDIVDTAARVAQLPIRPSCTYQLKIHGWTDPLSSQSDWQHYGSDIPLVEQQAQGHLGLLERLHPELPCRAVDVLWAIRHEMARTVEDVLSRRTRCLHLGARSSAEIAPKVAAIMANELGLHRDWEAQQVRAYQDLSRS